MKRVPVVGDLIAFGNSTKMFYVVEQARYQLGEWEIEVIGDDKLDVVNPKTKKYATGGVYQPGTKGVTVIDIDDITLIENVKLKTTVKTEVTYSLKTKKKA